MVIGLCGDAGAGKDTVCSFMLDWFHGRDVQVRREAFADRLKLSAARIFFPDIELVDAIAWCNQMKGRGTVEVTRPGGAHGVKISGRELLQRYGTEAHRNVFGTDFWVDIVLNLKGSKIITDVRFDNEAEGILAAGGQVICVKRPGGATINEAAHVSEDGISNHLVDHMISNNGDLDDLRMTVFRLLHLHFDRV